MNINLAIMKNRAKLEKMISDNEDYEKILKQSQKLDEYINMAMQEMTEQKKKEKPVDIEENKK